MTGYDWLRALHVISIIAWMAGLLYLPRLFVYHCDAPAGSSQARTFAVMERRLLWAIATPAMAASWLFGLWLAFAGGWWTAGWFHAKLALALGLTVMHALFARWQRHFARDANRHGGKFYRIVNEVPTALMIAIVILAIGKPF